LEGVVKKAQKKNEPVIARHWLLTPDDGLWCMMPFTVVQWYQSCGEMCCTHFQACIVTRSQKFVGTERTLIKYSKTGPFITAVGSTVVCNTKLSVVRISGFGCDTRASLCNKGPEM